MIHLVASTEYMCHLSFDNDAGKCLQICNELVQAKYTENGRSAELCSQRNYPIPSPSWSKLV